MRQSFSGARQIAQPSPKIAQQPGAGGIGRSSAPGKIFLPAVQIMLDLLSRIKYNKCVTESEVMKCHQEPADQKQRSPKKSDTVFVLTSRQKTGCKNIATGTASQGAKRYGKVYTCFCLKINKIPCVGYLGGLTTQGTGTLNLAEEGVNILLCPLSKVENFFERGYFYAQKQRHTVANAAGV